jgi:tetratricopeptide (TPR) repeat protein
MNRFILLLVAISFITGCNDNGESSAYSEILDQAPYSKFTDSIKMDGKRDDLYFRRAILLNKNNFPEPALADFKKAWSLSKKEQYAFGVNGILLQKNITEAIAFLQEAVKELPQSILLQLQLARAYDAQNKTDKALAVCKTILTQQTDQVNTLELQSELLLKKGDTAGSLASLEKAYELVPASNLQIGYKLLYKYAETKNPKTLTLADSLIAMDSLKLHADPYYVKGIYYSNINEKAKAIQWFNETIRQDYNYLNAYIEKGQILFEQKKIPEAFKTFQLANTIDAAFPDSWYWMAKCQELSGQKEDAKLNYEKAYALDNSFIEAKEAAEKIKL